MTAKGVLSMDSYRLAQYSVQVPCYICEGGNAFDTAICRHCCAPMALAHQAKSQKQDPRVIAAIGASASGKTVYLGMLTDMLSQPGQALQLVARGAFSISLQQSTVSALEKCCFPEKTPTEPDQWNWVHCQVRKSKQRVPIELVVPDIAGEALAEEIDHPGTFPVIASLLSKCQGIFMIIDAARMAEGFKDQEFFAMKMLAYLSELDDHPKKGWRDKPIAFVLTKADECELCFDDPVNFAREHSPGLWQQCQERFARHQIFASGVAGACTYRTLSMGIRTRVPLRIEPRGITEPFLWLIQQLK